MRPAPLVAAAIASLVLLAPAGDAYACGTGLGWFGGGGGGLWQRPPKEPVVFVAGTIILMGNEALGIPAGIEVDLSQPAPEPPSVIARLLGDLRDLVALTPGS